MTRFAAALALGWLAVFPPQSVAQDFDAVQIESRDLGHGIHLLTGRGGNIAASVGDDGVVLIDDQFAPLTPKILAAVRALSSEPVRFVINTHWHSDHTGGNENLGKAGAVIVAHDNVRVRMSVEQFMLAFNRRVPASPPKALPVVTFADAVTLHLNGEQIRIFHVDPAHTDGDSVIHFADVGVFHMGDTFFNGIYPFIDVGSGGTIDGMIAAAERVLALADGKSKIIPGHGPLADRAQLSEYRDMLAAVRESVAGAIAAGRTVEDVVASKPTARFDAVWGKGFMKPDDFVRIVYQALATP